MSFDRVPEQCFALDCKAGAKANMLMCWGHWKRVPRAIQHEIWMSNHLTHPDYESSRLAARAAVRVKEQGNATPDEVALLARHGIGPDAYPIKPTPRGLA